MKLLFIPDTQVKVGVNLDHIAALGNYIVDKKPDIIVMIGDWFDLPSLSSYEKKGSKYFEGLRYKDDVDIGLHAMDLLFKPMWQYNDMRVRNKKRPYKPRLVFFEGNHENRQTRAINEDPRLIGTIGFEDFQLEKFGWEVHRFLKIVEIEGVLFSHYFVNPDSLTGSVITGSIENKLKLIGHSFAQGHQQKRQYGNRYTGFGKELHGLVLGCLTPDHKVLMSDLTYKPIGDLNIGDKVVSFDEFSKYDGVRSRRYKTGTVLRCKPTIAPVYEVALESGKTFKVTGDHGWLRKTGSMYEWTTTLKLRKGTKIPKFFDEWEPDYSYDSGWLSGMYDGEGSFYSRQTTSGFCGQLALSQKIGPTLNKLIKVMENKFGVDCATDTTHGDVRTLRIKGGLTTIAKVLGTTRPERLLSKFKPELLGRVSCSDKRNDSVVSVKFLGDMKIIQTDIDEKTMIVEGYPHHNSFYSHDESYMNPQGNTHHWRGICLMHEIQDGRYDPSFVSLDFLVNKWV